MPVTHPPPVIQLDNVSFSYPNATILENISCTIRQGEYLAIIGPNGGGKTTLLRIILGLLKPSAGQILLFGKSDISPDDRSLLGYIPQRISSILFRFPTTVYEVVESGRTARMGMFHGLSPEDNRAIDQALQIADVTKYQKRQIGELSGGELQRVFIARALATEPKILILDEPTVGVDLKSQETFFAFLQKLNRQLGMTIIFVTHELDVAIHQASTVLCLNRKLVCHIASRDLTKGPYLEKLYGKQMHFITHTHRH